MSSFTLRLVLVTVYYHRIAVLCFSYHIICFTYTYHFLLCFMSAKTLETDTRNNCMYPKVLSLYEIVISICMYPKRGRYNNPNGIYVIDPNEVSISVNCMLQQLYPYRHTYLSNYPIISRQSVLLCFINNLLGIRKRYFIYMNNY